MTSASLFSVTAERNPQLLPRLVGFFAQQALVPSLVEARASDNDLRITIVQNDLCSLRAQIIATKMRSIVMVRTVELSQSCLTAEPE